MRNTQQLFWMIFLILISIAMLFGVLSLSQVEGIIHLPATTLPPSPALTNQPSNPPGNTPTPVIYTCPTAVPLSCPPALPPTPPPTWTPTTTQSLPTPPPTWTPAVTQVGSTPSPQTWTPTQTTSPLYCPVPSGWVAYTVRTGDTVEGLALRYKITTTAITRANCQITGSLLPGMVIYLPSLPTRTPVACGAPRYWVIYIVQTGDTLFHLGQIYGIPYTQIQRANCLVNLIFKWVNSSTYHHGPPSCPRYPSSLIHRTRLKYQHFTCHLKPPRLKRLLPLMTRQPQRPSWILQQTSQRSHRPGHLRFRKV